MGTFLCRQNENGAPIEDPNRFTENERSAPDSPVKDLDRALLHKLREMLALRAFTVKILLVGDKSVGKTALVSKFIHPLQNALVQAGDNTRTIGIEFYTKVIDLWGEKVRVRIWDSPGGLPQMSYVTQFLRDVDEIVVCYAYDDEQSAANVKEYLALVDQCNAEHKRLRTEFEQVLSRQKIPVDDDAGGSGDAQKRSFLVLQDGDLPARDGANLAGAPLRESAADSGAGGTTSEGVTVNTTPFNQRHGVYIAGLKTDVKAGNVIAVQEHILPLAAERGIDVLECSVKENRKVDATFVDIVKNYIARTNITAFADSGENNNGSRLI